MVAPEFSSKKIDKYVQNLNEILDADLRNIVEVRVGRTKQRDAVEALKKTITRMMYMNYTLRQQTILLCDNVPFFSMVVETYKKHVKAVLGNEILRMHKVNGMLCYKIKKIEKAALIYDDLKKQFESLGFADMQVYEDDYITFEDYKVFLDVYERSLEAQKDKARIITTTIRKKDEVKFETTRVPSKIELDLQNYKEFEKDEKDEVVVESLQKEDNSKCEVAKKADKEPIAVEKDEETVEKEAVKFESEPIGNANIEGFREFKYDKKAIVVDNKLTEIWGAGKQRKEDDFLIYAVQKDEQDIKMRIGIELDSWNIPGDLDEFANMSEFGNRIEEKHSYFANHEVFQMCDYTPQHNELVLINFWDGSQDDIGVFRYDERVNTIFFARIFTGHIGFLRGFEQWERKHQSREFFEILSASFKLHL